MFSPTIYENEVNVLVYLLSTDFKAPQGKFCGFGKFRTCFVEQRMFSWRHNFTYYLPTQHIRRMSP